MDKHTNPGPVFLKILKLKLRLKLIHKLSFMRLCLNSNISYFEKFLNSNSFLNSHLNSISEFMLKFRENGIYKKSQSEILLKLKQKFETAFCLSQMLSLCIKILKTHWLVIKNIAVNSLCNLLQLLKGFNLKNFPLSVWFYS